VTDPYYGTDGDFDKCLEVMSAGAQRLTSILRARLDDHARAL
jgi:hypothetical protein